MTDPTTGEAAQAVVSEVDSGAVRLIARLGRHLAMPRRSFLMTWHFVLEAPAQVCAHGQCEEPAYLRVNDLGTWVMVCKDHLPAHVQPLLPADDPDSSSFDRCPLCSASTHGQASNSHEVEGVVIEHCGSCDCYWVSVLGVSDEEDASAAEFDRGIQLGEALSDVAPLLEQRGLRVRGVIGQQALVALQRTIGGAGLSQESTPSFQGVELTVQPLLGNHLVLIGDRPRTGVQRLGGTPGRQSPQGSVTGVPERGSLWVGLLDETSRVRVVDVQIGETAGDPGRRMIVKVHTTGVPSREIEMGLREFLVIYQPVPSETAAVSETPPEKRRTPEPPPCEAGEEWETPEGSPVKVTLVTDTSVVTKNEQGLSQTIPIYIFRTRYKKAPPRRSVYERLMEDED